MPVAHTGGIAVLSASEQTDLDAVRAPIGRARGLPNAHYVSAEHYARERRAVLFGAWAGIGFGKDVPEPGDVCPVDFLGMPLLIVRDRAGELRVFQNTCRHRGMILVEKPTRLRRVIRCPYHSWCYELDGALRATPHVGGPGRNEHPDLSREELGLWPIRSRLWRDVVFVNLSGEAPPFEEYAAALIARWREHERPLAHGGEGSSFTLDVATNWKLAVENFCESYHLPWIHPALNSYSRLEDHYDIDDAAGYSGQGTRVYRRLVAGDGTTFPDFAGLSPEWDEGAEYVALYPNVLLGVHRDHAFAIVLESRGVERTLERVAIYYTEEGARDPRYSSLREENARLWRTVFEEDVSVVEGMQRGRHGELFDGGRFSPAMDRPTHRFHRWIAEAVAARGASRAAEDEGGGSA